MHGDVLLVLGQRDLESPELKAKLPAEDPAITRERMADAVLSLRVGEVVSYRDVASRAGRPDAPRMAGSVLAAALDSLPWWRVVYSDGRFPACNPSLQEEKLIAEGVEVRGFKVVRSPLGRFANSQ